MIDAEERETTKGELANGLLVNSAFAILRLGIATTLVTGAAMVASGQVDFGDVCLPAYGEPHLCAL